MKNNQKPIGKPLEQKPENRGLIPFVISTEKPLVPMTASKYDKLFAKLITYGQMGNNIRV